MMEDLQKQLYEKAAAQQQKFVQELRESTPEAIIEQAYELVIREDILIIFESEDLPKKQVKELLKLKEPISECYARWLHNDYSHMDMLKDTIGELADDLAKHSEEQKKAKKKHEPER